ncbi:AAEL014488-PA [Aedes aegypti]|uniref:AAEL014488-PA n=1 Tax=Aedes aegypti TaxID=7159 RepID=Q16G87_AEDAE|nr:AAEL014488-PA [Aedes aegypti]
MELKVWVEGIQRIVCGVTEVTTCQDVVFALAHATGKTGRFTLIERWRNNERLLAPHENPLKILMKWGEYSSDVHAGSPGNDPYGKQFSQHQQHQQHHLHQQSELISNCVPPSSLERGKETRKSLNSGVVLGKNRMRIRFTIREFYGFVQHVGFGYLDM